MYDVTAAAVVLGTVPVTSAILLVVALLNTSFSCSSHRRHSHPALVLNLVVACMVGSSSLLTSHAVHGSTEDEDTAEDVCKAWTIANIISITATSMCLLANACDVMFLLFHNRQATPTFTESHLSGIITAFIAPWFTAISLATALWFLLEPQLFCSLVKLEVSIDYRVSIPILCIFVIPALFSLYLLSYAVLSLAKLKTTIDKDKSLYSYDTLTTSVDAEMLYCSMRSRVKTLIVITSFFLVLWLPYIFFLLMATVCSADLGHCPPPVTFQQVSLWCGYAALSFSPALVFLDRHIRNTFMANLPDWCFAACVYKRQEYKVRWLTRSFDDVTTVGARNSYFTSQSTI